jgi:hypothetical protein
VDELSKTYTLTHSAEGWRVHLATGIAPGFGLEPQHSLLEVIDRVEKLYPEYRPRLDENQLGDYTFQLKHRVDENPGFVPEAVNALMRCVPPELRESEKLVLEEVAKRTFRNDHGLMALIEGLKNGKAVNERQTGAGISGREHRLSVDHQAREIEKLIRQTAELREGLIGLANNLQKPSASLDRSGIAEQLAILHHHLSDLRAHVDIAKREVVLAKRTTLPGNGFARDTRGFRVIRDINKEIEACTKAFPFDIKQIVGSVRPHGQPDVPGPRR